MAFVPIANNDEITDQFNFEVPRETPRAQGFMDELEADFNKTPVMMGESFILRHAQDVYGHGQWLSPQEIQEKYPSAASKYKSGGYENDVAFDNNVIAHNDEKEALANNMAPGFLSGATRFAGSLASMMLSPTNIIAGGAVAKVAKFGEDALIGSKIMQSVAGRAIVKAGIGAAEGGTISDLPTLTNILYQKNIGRPEAHPLEALGENFVIGSLLGAGLKTGFGYKTIVDPDHASYALETAQNQFNAGKKIKVDPIIQQGMVKASQDWTETPEEINAVIDKLQKKNVELKDSYENVKKAEEAHISNLSDDEKEVYNNMRKSENWSDFKKNFKDIVEEKKITNDDFDKAKEYFNPVKNLNKIVDDNQELLDNTSTYAEMVANKPQPLTNEDLSRNIEELNSRESDADFNQAERDRQEGIINDNNDLYQPREEINDEELDKFLDKHDAYLNDEIKELDNSGLLNQEDKDYLDEAQSEEENHNTLAKSLRKFMYCTLSGGA